MAINSERAKELLRHKGLRATEQRTQLVMTLLSSKAPASVEVIAQKTKGAIDLATVYRALLELERVQLVRRINRKNGSLYELLGTHHHHLICRVCGTIEDVDVCLPKSLYTKLLKGSRQFARVEDHELEFVGICTRCEKRI